MARISFIMPVYNGAELLPEAVDSIISQSYKDWELIIVDDGSTDGTGAICDRYEERDSRIRVIHKENGGVSDARNRALGEVKGDYISFVDADDHLHPRFAELMLDAAERAGVDETVGEADFYTGKYVPCETPDRLKVELSEPFDYVEKTLYQTGFDNGPWGKLYRRELWEDFRFAKGLYYEDLDIFYRIAFRCRKIAHVPYKLYGYRQHAGSVIHGYSAKRFDILEVGDRMMEWAQENCRGLLPAVADRRMAAHFNVLLLLYSRGVEDRETEERCWRVIREQRWRSLFSRKTRIRNKMGALLSIIGGKRGLRWGARIMHNA